jgi:hypothetical protein
VKGYRDVKRRTYTRRRRRRNLYPRAKF